MDEVRSKNGWKEKMKYLQVHQYYVPKYYLHRDTSTTSKPDQAWIHVIEPIPDKGNPQKISNRNSNYTLHSIKVFIYITNKDPLEARHNSSLWEAPWRPSPDFRSFPHLRNRGHYRCRGGKVVGMQRSNRGLRSRSSDDRRKRRKWDEVISKKGRKREGDGKYMEEQWREKKKRRRRPSLGRGS